MGTVLFIIYCVLSIGGMMLVKLGVGHPLTIKVASGSLLVSAGWLTIVGLLLYVGSFFLWTKLVTMFELSYFVPIATAITQVVVVLLSLFVFKETFTTFKVLGILLAISGVVLMNLK